MLKVYVSVSISTSKRFHRLPTTIRRAVGEALFVVAGPHHQSPLSVWRIFRDDTGDAVYRVRSPGAGAGAAYHLNAFDVLQQGAAVHHQQLVGKLVVIGAGQDTKNGSAGPAGPVLPGRFYGRRLWAWICLAWFCTAVQPPQALTVSSTLSRYHCQELRAQEGTGWPCSSSTYCRQSLAEKL